MPANPRSKMNFDTKTAVNTLAIRPITSVTAKPFTGPVPNRNRKAHDTTVVTWVSMIVRKALLNPALTAAIDRLAGAQLFADALKDQHVTVDRHTDAENDAGDAGQCQHGSEISERRQAESKNLTAARASR